MLFDIILVGLFGIAVAYASFFIKKMPTHK